MSYFKDVFISYGRQESKHFVTRLYQSLIKTGLEVWFDQNDIPLGVDFQDQIDDGIEKAHNFIFVISPHSVRSPYCLKEIVLAAKRGKRIIPVLHVEPVGEWDKMHPAIAKRNWVYMREKADKNLPLTQWEAIDDFERGLENILALINQKSQYVQLHTEILTKAIAWERKSRATELLLVGQERHSAEDWLLTENDNLPCEPSALHTEFIAESKKNSENLHTDVFISYAEKDRQARDLVIEALNRRAYTCWTHNRDIQKGAVFGAAIESGIEQADNLLFFISPESVVSEWCQRELAYAKSLHKRIIPLLVAQTDPGTFPVEIAGLQYIDFTDNTENKKQEVFDDKFFADKLKITTEDSASEDHSHGFQFSNAEVGLSKNEKTDLQRDMDEIIAILRSESEYYWLHKSFLVQALRWERQQNNTALLLKGFNLDKARSWLDANAKRTQHAPTDLHRRFVEESIACIGQLATEVFISYSRKDGDFARKLNIELQNNEKTTWFDQESIADGSDFKTEIFKGIASSDNFLFVISPDSIASPYCAEEVQYAASLGKRFITILIRPTDPATIPAELSSVQWLDFSTQGFERGFSQLLRALDIDRDYVAAHTRWSQNTQDWRNKSRRNDLLLRGDELIEAEKWLAASVGKKPQPTERMREYINRSREFQEIETQKYMLGQFEKLALLDRQQALEDSIARRENSRFATTMIIGAVISLLVLLTLLGSGNSSDLSTQLIELGYSLFALFFVLLAIGVNGILVYQRTMRRATNYYQKLMMLATEWKSGNREVLLNASEIREAERWIAQFVERRKAFSIVKIQSEFLEASRQNPAQRGKVRKTFQTELETVRDNRRKARRNLVVFVVAISILFPFFVMLGDEFGSEKLGFLFHNALSLSGIGFFGWRARKFGRRYEVLEAQGEVGRQAILWELCQRDPKLLAQGNLLSHAVYWLDKAHDALTQNEQDYIKTSLEAYQIQNPGQTPQLKSRLDRFFNPRVLVVVILIIVLVSYLSISTMQNTEPNPPIDYNSGSDSTYHEPYDTLQQEMVAPDSLGY